MRATFTRWGILAAVVLALGAGVSAPAYADYGWGGPYRHHPPGWGYYRRPPPPRYYAPPPVYYAPAPVYRYVPPPPVYYAPPAIGFGVTIY